MKRKLTDDELIALLKNLPRAEAPENFEFNLMTRIRNGNFGELAEEEKTNWLWITLPSATIVTAAVVILMFMFSSVEQKNTIPTVPQKVVKAETKTYLIVEKEPAKTDGEIEAVKIVKAPNDVVTKQRVRIPVNKSAGVSVDNFLNKPINGNGGAATLVSSEEKLPFQFREFLPYTAVPKKKVEKANNDSVKTIRQQK
jgi:hypothetical protein